MAVIFKCKMCGGDLNIQDGSPVTECEYCGTQQTVPSLDNEKKSNLFARANRLRFNNEFDKASGVFESIVAEFPEEAEAYWGLCLCKYGIEYVDDPATAKKVPTCHRTSFESIFDDSNFDLALEYSDPVAHKLYREEAKEIDRLQKSILEIANKEEPFDVFICYKETAEDGQRTKDSVLAQDIYDALSAKGYKVFFARITLEDKLGQEYEPYIFAALNSAKVMLSVGTKYEYFNAVWVKNEWSRFLEMKKKHPEKVLIPCYADIDAYDMPQEFRNLQGQDMGKVGFLQDLVRGIGKIIPRDEEKPVQREVVHTAASADVNNLVNRMYVFLEDGDWENARNYCEKILDIDYQCAEAYVGKLMADVGARKRTALAELDKPFDDNDNYKKAERYGGEQLKAELDGYIAAIKDRIEQERLAAIYQQAKGLLENHNYTRAEEMFRKLGGYKDSEALAEQCVRLETESRQRAEKERKEDIYNKAKCDMEQERFDEAAAFFCAITGYKDADELAARCDQLAREYNERVAESQREEKYTNAVAKIKSKKIADLQWAISELEEIKDWRDSAQKINKLKARIKKIKKCRIISLVSVAAAIAATAAGIFVYNTAIVPMLRYNEAVKLAESGSYNEAIVAFAELGDYKDSDERFWDCKYNYACSLADTGNYDEAIRIFSVVGDYKDCKGMILSAKYDKAAALFDSGDPMSAYKIFKELGDHGDSAQQAKNAFAAVRDAAPKNVVAVGDYLVALKEDGTVVSDASENWYYKYSVGEWDDISAVFITDRYIHGMHEDGTVSGSNGEYSYFTSKLLKEVGSVSDLKLLTEKIYVLKSDGTIECSVNDDAEVNEWSKWTDIVAFDASEFHVVGVRTDGTVIASGDNEYGACDVTAWNDIVDVECGRTFSVGLKADGTVVCTKDIDGLDDWTEIIMMDANNHIIVGLKADGTIVSVPVYKEWQSNVQVALWKDWQDIVSIDVDESFDANVNNAVIGLKKDGTVVHATLDGTDPAWTNIRTTN